MPDPNAIRELDKLNCPECGKEMEPGTLRFIVSPKIGAGVNWTKEGITPGIFGKGREDYHSCLVVGRKSMDTFVENASCWSSNGLHHLNRSSVDIPGPSSQMAHLSES
jgi:hypothetical protein